MNLPFEDISREILTKKEATTDPKFGKSPESRTIKELLESSVFALNKVEGPSSHQVSDYAKKALEVEKMGHGGTLDPAVTGVLPIAIGKATKVMEALLKSKKEYICLMHLHAPAQISKIHKTSKEFIGKITQLPPVKSAVKRQLRDRDIYYLEVFEIKDQDVLFKVGCQAGTYIRTLCLAPETELITNKGIKTIKEICENKEKLILFCFNNNKITTTKIIDFQKIPFNKSLLEITTYSRIKIKVTPDHELLKSTDNGPTMEKAGNLKLGDYLFRSNSFPDISKEYCIAELIDEEYYVHNDLIKDRCKEELIKKYGSIREFYRQTRLDRKPFVGNYKIDIRIKHLKLAGMYEEVKNQLNCFKTEKGKIIKINPKLSKDLLYLIGLIASDGNNTKEKKTIRHTRIKFSNTNKEIIKIFENTIKKLFPNIKVSKKFKKGSWVITSSNSLLATLCAKLGIKSPFKKNDFKSITELENNLIKSFLRGYLDGDGYVNNDLEHTRIEFSCINYSNIKRIHQMLLKLNIQNIIVIRKAYNKKNKIYSDFYDIKLIDPSSKLKFCREIGSNHPLKKKRLKNIEEYFKNINKNPEDYLYEPQDRKKYLKEIKGLNVILGGNYYKMTKYERQITKNIYKKLRLINNNLPKVSDFTLEEIREIREVPFKGYVYDVTVDKNRNFLIENGIVSSNCVSWGKTLGTNGHMQQLVRTKSGPFNDKECYSLQDIKDAYESYKEGNEKELKKILKPLEYAVSNLPKIWIQDSAVDSICHGANLTVPGITKLNSKIQKKDLVAVFTLKDELVSLGEAQLTSEEIISNSKGVAVKTNKVLMETEVYPHFKKA